MHAHALTVDDCLGELNTSFGGLSDGEAALRLAKYGKNTLARDARFRMIKIFFRQWRSPLVWLLVAAVLVTVAIGEFADAGIIGAAVIVSVIFGFFQEAKAETSLRRLAEVVPEYALVLRGGERKEIPVEDAVPGDILILHAGTSIPADGRLIEARGLEMDEAALTGESLSITKKLDPLPAKTTLAERRNCAYKGTLVAAGEGVAVVFATGLQSELGKISKGLKEIEEAQTPLARQIAGMARAMAWIVLGILVALFTLGFVRKINTGTLFTTTVAVAAAAVPEGLTVSVTATLAVGMLKLLRRKALVRKLLAAETLGAVTTLITDKTGTLTQGVMSLTDIVPARADRHGDLLRALVLASAAELHDGKAVGATPTDRALLEGAVAKGGEALREVRKNTPMTDAIPFAPTHRFRAVQIGSEVILVGAPEVMMQGARDKDNILQAAWEELAGEGKRVIAIARRTLVPDTRLSALTITDIPRDLTLIGLAGLSDPLRPEVKGVIAAARRAGVTVRMATGDNEATARAIAAEAGIDQVDARVTPKDKLAILDRLHARNEVVAMIGDGVNDALALKRADVGVVMGSGTAVSKEVADLVLLDNNFKTIIAAIEQGRVIFANIRKVVVFLFFDSFTEVVLIATAILAGLPLPLLPAQIVWVNLLEDTFPAFALSLEEKHGDPLSMPPRRRGTAILSRPVMTFTVVLGLLTAAILLAFFLYVMAQNGEDIGRARTLTFLALGINSLVMIFSLRALETPLWKVNHLKNPALIGAVALGLALYGVAFAVPALARVLSLSPVTVRDLVVIVGLGVVYLGVVELLKTLFRRQLRTA